MNSLARLGLFLTLACAALGCSGSTKAPPYANVTGTVKYDGKPLKSGSITFSTDGRPPTVMDIIEGSYSGQAMVGDNKIVISAQRKRTGASKLPKDAQDRLSQGAGVPPERGGGPRPDGASFDTEEMIPADYNTASKQTRAVAAGDNKFDFDIRAKP